jgi:peptide/nickel transport system ATP-binding protein
MDTDTILSIKDLHTSFRVGGQYYDAVDGVNLDLKKNEVLAIVGESGSGKSAFALSIPMLHNMNYTKVEGDIRYNGQNLTTLPDSQLNSIRGSQISMIFQDPLVALNPLIKVGHQIDEAFTYHTNLNADEKKAASIDLLTKVGMTRPELTYDQFPHELSGGMRQRAMIALAIANKPAIIIADEPTTALDVTIQAQILDLIKDLQEEMGSSVILITHDLGVVAEIADRVAVMYAGQLVEVAPVEELFAHPRHPYTRSLLASIPNEGVKTERLKAIKGIVPTLKHMPREGCRFARRTPWVDPQIHEDTPTYHQIGPDHQVLCTCYERFALEGEQTQADYVKVAA